LTRAERRITRARAGRSVTAVQRGLDLGSQRLLAVDVAEGAGAHEAARDRTALLQRGRGARRRAARDHDGDGNGDGQRADDADQLPPVADHVVIVASPTVTDWLRPRSVIHTSTAPPVRPRRSNVVVPLTTWDATGAPHCANSGLASVAT